MKNHRKQTDYKQNSINISGSNCTLIERFSIECRETKTKVITLANNGGHRQSSEPIKTRSNYMKLTQSACE